MRWQLAEILKVLEREQSDADGFLWEWLRIQGESRFSPR